MAHSYVALRSPSTFPRLNTSIFDHKFTSRSSHSLFLSPPFNPLSPRVLKASNSSEKFRRTSNVKTLHCDGFGTPRRNDRSSIWSNRFPVSISRNGLSLHVLKRKFQASLRSVESTSNSIVTPPGQQSEIIFVGTGTSEGIPRVSCLTDPVKICSVCKKAAEPDSKNRRLNTSILIRFNGSSGIHNLLIDAGKFFYHSALRWFPTYGIRTIDAVIITHSHADAIGGLDDLRDWTNNVQPSIPIYVAKRDFEVMKKTHYYLVDTSVVLKGAAVSELQFIIIDEEPFSVHDLKITPLPVWHGRGYRSLGFRFGNICYISDVSDIPDETYPLLEDCELLILDALKPEGSTPTHFGLPRALDEVRKIQPKRTLFTGMMHHMDHEEVNAYLLKLKDSEGLDVQLSYDGLRVPINI
ncbi:putative hydrolase C777.06c isoform X1 [Beta vulgaris subsp. vulgaris]|uniref:putative hydrolase C777.06c isoform X1 n=1 Tax=Beta vulgaris subsp. vulgaris TaxID=3555 RepID=UPI002036EB70|nr:putative hydrolase C777.06c isoform X1 [Beta vulgaris subsp. vulgaris]